MTSENDVGDADRDATRGKGGPFAGLEPRAALDGLAGLPLLTRSDVQRAVIALCSPAEPCRSAGGSGILLGSSAAHFAPAVQRMEGFCRLLWGLAPLLAGGGEYEGSSRILEGLANGSDSRHPEFWGVPHDRDQRLVEFAAIAMAMLIAPDVFWRPLSSRQRRQLGALLGAINRCQVRDNNWLFFRVLVNLACASVDAPHGSEQMRVDLERLDSFYLGQGWYTDGPGGPCDYYVPFAMHFYALIYARYAGGVDPVRASSYRDRAAEFAAQFIHWFSPDGSALPYGRSQTYRFAQAAFWGACELAGVECLAPGVTKGLLLRHLRWWLARPICDESALLTVGYGYANLLFAENYFSPCAP
jgi:hypothetical protein